MHYVNARATARISRCVLALLVLTGCSTERASEQAEAEVEVESATAVTPAALEIGDSPWLTDRAADSGLDFVHFNGASGDVYHFPEIMSGGAGVLDYDSDGDLDVYLVQGQLLGEGRTPADALFPPQGPLPLRGRLYRNDLTVVEGRQAVARFTDVTDESGVESRGYGMGLAAGDIDNDGWVDLYLTHYGTNQLFRNNGDGTFTEISSESGTADRGWGVSAAFVDYDRDGWLDLYVGNYVSYSVDTGETCKTPAGAPGYCMPAVYPPQPDRLYRNRGDGTFEDVTVTALVGGAFGRALGVSTADFDNDGWIDIYVANDGQENQLWMNQGDGTFRDEGVISGASVNASGRPEAGMGVDAGDLDHDGDEDLFIAHFTGETNTLYTNDGTGLFEDRSASTGLGPPSLNSTGFGTAWIDVDNNGELDSLVVNGAVTVLQSIEEDRHEYPYGQPNQLFLNLGDRRFEDVSDRAGEAFRLEEVSRGAAFGDVDNDGDVDVVVNNTNGPARLFTNEIGHRSHWVGLRLRGTPAVGGRDMLGARVEVTRADGLTLQRRARSDGSYASANDPRVLVGLGATSQPVQIRVIWPDGSTETWSDVAADQWHSLQQGAAR